MKRKSEFNWLNDLRNCIAHEFEPLNSERFRTLVGSFGVPWPVGALERAVTTEYIVYKTFYAAFSAHTRWSRELATGPPKQKTAKRPSWEKTLRQKQRQRLREIYAKLDDLHRQQEQLLKAEFELIRAGRWDDVIALLRPAGQPRLVKAES